MVLEEQKVLKGKRKTVLFIIPGVIFTTALKEMYADKRVEGEITRSLQDLVRVLQDQLKEERLSRIWEKVLLAIEPDQDMQKRLQTK